ncbi:hypothetical protein AGLY_007798 [Aphis glycines]|uniref:Uncharacterized protein n=1 Tax=Aphis glycines TaxID=307491 RepID=A0A6G0TNL3_APHGL|nr:hypothetical protein AGLY_007798 [Aphis glycines]
MAFSLICGPNYFLSPLLLCILLKNRLSIIDSVPIRSYVWSMQYAPITSVDVVTSSFSMYKNILSDNIRLHYCKSMEIYVVYQLDLFLCLLICVHAKLTISELKIFKAAIGGYPSKPIMQTQIAIYATKRGNAVPRLSKIFAMFAFDSKKDSLDISAQFIGVVTASVSPSRCLCPVPLRTCPSDYTRRFFKLLTYLNYSSLKIKHVSSNPKAMIYTYFKPHRTVQSTEPLSHLIYVVIHCRLYVHTLSKFQYYIIIHPMIITIIHYRELEQVSAADLCAWTWFCSKTLPHAPTLAEDKHLTATEACSYSE